MLGSPSSNYKAGFPCFLWIYFLLFLYIKCPKIQQIVGFFLSDCIIININLQKIYPTNHNILRNSQKWNQQKEAKEYYRYNSMSLLDVPDKTYWLYIVSHTSKCLVQPGISQGYFYHKIWLP